MAAPVQSTSVKEQETYIRVPSGKWLKLSEVKDVMIRYYCPLLHIPDPVKRRRFEIDNNITTRKSPSPSSEPQRKSPPPPPESQRESPPPEPYWIQQHRLYWERVRSRCSE